MPGGKAFYIENCPCHSQEPFSSTVRLQLLYYLDIILETTSNQETVSQVLKSRVVEIKKKKKVHCLQEKMVQCLTY